MKNNIKISLIIIGVIGIGLITYLLLKEGNVEMEEEKDFIKSNNKVVLSLEDEVEDDTLWCGTMNLIWNDLKNELVKQDIVFKPQLKEVANLNKGTFNTKHLSENSYYKTYGTPTLEFKNKIEKDIKTKFNQKSDILDDFNWDGDEEDFFLYTMLYKAFNFPKKFIQLENASFDQYEDVKYFGYKKNDYKKYQGQINVLFYEDINNFAIKLLTKENDELIFAKGVEGNSFLEIYQNTLNLGKKFKGNKSISNKDEIKIPYLNFKIKEEFESLENKAFNFASGKEYVIDKAVQTIQFELNETGGKIKSEAGLGLKVSSFDSEVRNFYLNSKFTLFLQETGKELPYFAANISNIKDMQ